MELKKRERRTTTSVYLTSKQLDKLEKIALEKRLSRNSLIEYILASWLKKYDKEQV